MLWVYALIMTEFRLDNTTLIIRLWTEKKTRGGELWRGSIQRIPNGDLVYFQTLSGCLEKLTSLLSEFVGAEKLD